MDGRLNRASNKLEDAWAILRIIEASQDALSFKAAFAALLVACRSIPDAIDRELKPILRARKEDSRGSKAAFGLRPLVSSQAKRTTRAGQSLGVRGDGP